MAEFEANILGCINRYKDYKEADKWLQRAENELQKTQFYRLLEEISVDLDIEQYALVIDKMKSRHSKYSEILKDGDDAHSSLQNKNIDVHDDNDEPSIDFLPERVSTEGSGPYNNDVFDTMIKKMGIDVFGINNSEINLIILGQRDWNKESLEEHIEGRRGKHLRVYSQEMFLAYVASKEDPYDHPALLLEFGQNHPALQHILWYGFCWQETTFVDYLHYELLSYLGYNVGENGGDIDLRREVLSNVMQKKLPILMSSSYMQEWGKPMTVGRLQKLANTIASYVINAKQEKYPLQEAIEDWERDLEWLKETYYSNELNFQWPDTLIYPSHDDLAVEKIDWPQDGLLSVMGYHVGLSGLDVSSRRKILDDVMRKRVPNVKSASHMDEWSEPMTAARLKKMANAIATFAKNAKRRKPPLKQAIEDWESDLAWLKENYYNNSLSFRWPST